jgi:hypothetical protein
MDGSGPRTGATVAGPMVKVAGRLDRAQTWGDGDAGRALSCEGAKDKGWS